MRRAFFIYFSFFSVISVQASVWQAIEGNYSRVEYTVGNRQVADSLLEIAEMAIPRLAKMTGVSLQSFRDSKTRIILTDAPDVTNGYAIGNAIVIYALSSGFALSWSSNDSWYKLVLTHELTHHTVFRASRRKISIFGIIADNSVPRWFHEGIAQYFAETWNAFRGDIFLKNAILSGQLSYQAINDWKDGAILYAGGHAFVRWLAWQYGDSSLIRLLRYEPDSWIYDFDKAFEAEFDHSPENLFAQFLRHMIIAYGDRLAAYPEEKFFKRFPVKNLQVFDLLPYNRPDSSYIAVVKLDPVHSYRTVLLAKLKNRKKLKAIYTITNHINTDLFFSADKHLVAFGRYSLSSVHDQTGIRFDWFIHDLQKRTTRLVARNVRARSAVFTKDKALVLIHTRPAGSLLVRYSLSGQKTDTLLVSTMPIGYGCALDKNSLVLDAQRPNGWHDLFLFDIPNGTLHSLTRDSLINRYPLALNDSLIAFNRIEDKNLTIAVYDIQNKRYSTHINDQYAYWLKHYDSDNRELIVSRWESKRKASLFTLPLDSLLQARPHADLSCVNPFYPRWESHTPIYGNLGSLPDTNISVVSAGDVTIPHFPMLHLLSAAVPFYTGKETGWSLFGLTAWADPLQRQLFQLTFYADQRGADYSLVMAVHLLRAWNQVFATTLYHGPVIFSFDENEYVQTYQDVVSLNWSHPWNPGGNPRVTLKPSLSYNGYRYIMKNKRPNLPQRYAYHGPSADFSIIYNLPTRYGSALYKRFVYGRINLFQSMEAAYRFTIAQADVHLASNLFWEELGLKTRLNYTTTSGTLPPLNRMGIDRFFGIDVPRDLTYTRTVRGVREDISARRMAWASAELTYMMSEKNNLKLLVLPLNLLTFTAFYDYARLQNENIVTISGYGAEVTFGLEIIRLGVGYARGRDSAGRDNEEVYMRIILGSGF